jgi:hypothetical protein
MTQLSPRGLRAVGEIANRTGFTKDAVTSMLFSVIAGRGRMAQFRHPEFGGSGQWMAGGAIVISDMFNNALKARVDALCNELSALVGDEPDFAAHSFQSQSQGVRGNLQRGSSSLLVSEGFRPSELVADGSGRSVQPPSAERSSLRLLPRHSTTCDRYQRKSYRLRHTGPSDQWVLAATARGRLAQFLQPARRR